MAHLDATSTEQITWFRLNRHEDATSDADETAEEETETDADAEEGTDATERSSADSDDASESDDADKLGDKGKKALDAMKADRNRAKREAADAKKQMADLVKRVAEFEDRDKTEQEKLAAKAEQAEKRAVEATARAVKAEVKALSVDQFADPSDAADVLMRDPAKYVDASGDIDEDAIRADLEDLLARKPHWRKPEPVVEQETKKTPAKQKPKPDPGQGGRGDKAVDYRTADKATVDAELSKFGIRPRR